MAVDGVIINKGKQGFNALGDGDNTSIMIVVISGAGKLPAGVAINTLKTIYSLDDALALGITPEVDVTNTTKNHRQVSEFYRMAGDGTKLYLVFRLLTGGTLAWNIDPVTGPFKDAITQSDGDAKQLGIFFGDNDYTADVMLDGLPTRVNDSIAKCQALVDWSEANFRPLAVLLEGFNVSGTVASMKNLRTLTYEAVGLVIGNDGTYATLANDQKYGDVGTALGTLASCRSSQNIGEVETKMISSDTRGEFLKPQLSSGTSIKTYTPAQLNTLDSKGYIFPIIYVDYPGTYWNDDKTCCAEIMDVNGNMNASSLSKQRVIQKAIRLVRRAMLPEVKKTIELDPTTGKLPSSTIKAYEALAESAIDIMGSEISGRKVKINPDSNLLTGDKILELTYIKVVPKGQIGIVKGKINLVKNL